MNKVFQSVPNKKEKNHLEAIDTFSSKAVSFWECKTKEDKIARNLWLCFTMGLLAISSLILILNGTIFFSNS